MTEISVVCTGEKWIGYGYRAFSSVIEELINGAKNNIVMTVYLISDIKLVKMLKGALERGVCVDVFINYYNLENKSEAYEELEELRRNFSCLTLHIKKDIMLHAKILVTDTENILIGSANPTFSGLIKNYEIGLQIRDKELAIKILNLLRRLI